MSTNVTPAVETAKSDLVDISKPLTTEQLRTLFSANNLDLTALAKEPKVKPEKTRYQHDPFEQFPKVKVGTEQLERSKIKPEEGNKEKFVLDFTTQRIFAENAPLMGVTVDELYRQALWTYAMTISEPSNFNS